MHGDDVSISDVLTKHGDNVLSVTFKAYRRRFISDVPTMHGDDVSISDVLTKHGENVFISGIQSLERTFYQ